MNDDLRSPTAWAPPNARWSLVAFAAVMTAATITACGSAGPPSDSARRGGPLLQYAQCIRVHGIPTFPDPSGHAGLVIPDDINPQSPAFKSTEQACAKLAEPPEGQTGSSTASDKLQLLALARCMRSHGVPNFADPTTSPPPPSGGNILGGNGSYLALGTPPQRRSPAYKRAAALCGRIP